MPTETPRPWQWFLIAFLSQVSSRAQAPAHKPVLFRIPPKASQVANADICTRLWLSCFFSLICQDNHFPILLNKHRLPCLNTITVLTEHTAFNHSAVKYTGKSLRKESKHLQPKLADFAALQIPRNRREKPGILGKGI